MAHDHTIVRRVQIANSLTHHHQPPSEFMTPYNLTTINIWTSSPKVLPFGNSTPVVVVIVKVVVSPYSWREEIIRFK